MTRVLLVPGEELLGQDGLGLPQRGDQALGLVVLAAEGGVLVLKQKNQEIKIFLHCRNFLFVVAGRKQRGGKRFFSNANFADYEYSRAVL